MAIIEFKNFSYKYPLSEDWALKNITMEIEQGEFIGVIGPNGGGKTSLANAIRGFIPHFYKGEVEGQLLLKGVDMANIELNTLADKIGYIFQNPFNQISYVKETCFEEIAYGLENLGVDPEEIRKRTQAIIDRLNIAYLSDKNPVAISGGQQQRVALASILVMEPDILVIDEPTSQLDPLGTEQVFEVIDLIKKEGKTVILIEHKIDLMARYADKIAVLQDGELKMFGPSEEVLSNPEILNYGATMSSFARLGNALKAKYDIDRVPITEEEAYQMVRKILEVQG